MRTCLYNCYNTIVYDQSTQTDKRKAMITPPKSRTPFADSALAKFLDRRIEALKDMKTEAEIAKEIWSPPPFHPNVQAGRSEVSSRHELVAGGCDRRHPSPPFPVGAGAALAWIGVRDGPRPSARSQRRPKKDSCCGRGARQPTTTTRARFRSSSVRLRG
jgi:hypothetical protein